jgi:hypothetical protein
MTAIAHSNYSNPAKRVTNSERKSWAKNAYIIAVLAVSSHSFAIDINTLLPPFRPPTHSTQPAHKYLRQSSRAVPSKEKPKYQKRRKEKRNK